MSLPSCVLKLQTLIGLILRNLSFNNSAPQWIRRVGPAHSCSGDRPLSNGVSILAVGPKQKKWTLLDLKVKHGLWPYAPKRALPNSGLHETWVFFFAFLQYWLSLIQSSHPHHPTSFRCRVTGDFLAKIQIFWWFITQDRSDIGGWLWHICALLRMCFQVTWTVWLCKQLCAKVAARDLNLTRVVDQGELVAMQLQSVS